MTTADPVLVDTLVANHQRFLAFLEQRMGSHADAEDLLQDAFVKGLERGRQLDDPDSAVAWFYRLLRNALTDWYRHRGVEDRAHARFAAREDLVDDPPDAELFDTVCRCALELAPTLKAEYAEALRRVELDGIAVKDYAIEAGISANNAAVRLHRAREALRTRVIEACDSCTEHGCLDCTCRR